MSDSRNPHRPRHGLRAGLGLSLGALGVVFGDIGTSPLYTMRECLTHLQAPERAAGVLGVLSLMIWSLMCVVGWKYLIFVMKADNRGEGGIFALLALSHSPSRKRKAVIGLSSLVVLAGAALLYGDGIITPAISVLSASEGLATFSSAFAPYSVAISVVILAGLFSLQSKGTETIGRLFGPVMVLWFTALGALGLVQVVHLPQVLAAFNPLPGLRLLAHHPGGAAVLLGAVVLTFTGAEALYADMGHFGRAPIARAWNFVVFPSLVLNYLGQGAYALAHPQDPTNPFFAIAPAGGLRLSLVVLSIAATIIASQALISGTFSLTQQAIQLGYFPRLKILHTNPDQPGQIYMPFVNQCLAIGAIWIVIGFKTSSALASAYGIAVTGTMLITSLAFFRVCRSRWRWPAWRAGLLCASFLALDIPFFVSNLDKIADGGWMPLSVALAVLLVMVTWKTGRSEIMTRVYSEDTESLDLAQIARSRSITRIPGSAVFMVASVKGTPLALLHHLKTNRVLQRTAVLLTVLAEEVPFVPENAKLTIESLGEGIWRAVGRFGYMESPDVADLVRRIAATGVPLDCDSAAFYFNREMILTGGDAPMFEWQKRLYAFLSRNAQPVKDYYRLMPTQIIEIGLPVQL
ncbi:Low affinity potassium transport system protein kup [mine drainage metagenome]|uniref:Low affinity potassium transport system protein kup n=1 Tax=mine drainage metagenome TaxID=410659 RepID=A0A1J5TQY4_9ZZZZ